jgi:radical SAM-linked protein
MTLQRLRIVFRKGGEIKYISHLDLMRAWERALRRADMPLAHSRGFNPRPKLSFAAALAVGFTGRMEMLDIFLEQRLGLRQCASRVKAQLPIGLQLQSVFEVSAALASLPSLVTAAEYEVLVRGEEDFDDTNARLRSLLAAESIPRCRERPDKVRTYDLRPLIDSLWLVRGHAGEAVVGMRLRAGSQGTGRPDEVMDALGMAEAVRGIERTKIVLEPI